ncbi:hypothetical protein [Mycobacterium sp. 050134]
MDFLLLGMIVAAVALAVACEVMVELVITAFVPRSRLATDPDGPRAVGH